MTLVELLVTVVIISILAGLILGVASIAGETAREAQTRHVVARLHRLLAEHYDTYKTRRVRLRETVGNVLGIEHQIAREFPLDPSSSGYRPDNGVRRGLALAEAKLYALREMILMETPDRWTDVLLTNIGTAEVAPFYLVGRTGLSNLYLRRYKNISPTKENESAECLFMIITLATADGEARTLFGENSIGDTDGDGAREFLDGWGHPISFIRWAPGFDSQIQINANQLDNPSTGTSQQAWTLAVASDHDPFDVFRRDSTAFRLVPLIYSAGRDEAYGIYDGSDVVEPIWRTTTAQDMTFRNSSPFIAGPQISPCAKIGSGGGGYLGTEISIIYPTQDKTATDNVHNHLLGQR